MLTQAALQNMGSSHVSLHIIIVIARGKWVYISPELQGWIERIMPPTLASALVKTSHKDILIYFASAHTDTTGFPMNVKEKKTGSRYSGSRDVQSRISTNDCCWHQH